ncbi:cupin domain-containing protein [Burkholderia glumae]|uniref:cupin domain-containing protein n=1 Tax=Burkholderia glumae TaxID=337 RepID=UPI003B9F06CA
MDHDTFVAALAREGFAAPVAVRREPGSMAEHAHPFEAKALIVAGKITLRIAGVDTVYRPGDVFHLPAQTPHAEFYGPAGVDYLAGRK